MEVITTQEVSLGDRLFGWWYRIAAPPGVPDEAPLQERIRARSGRLTSVVFLIQLIFFMLSLIVALLYAPFTVPADVVIMVMLLIGVFLNRIGKTVIAGIFVITVLVLGLVADFLVTPGGLNTFLLSFFDFFIGSELVAASLITPWAVLPVTLVNCLITVGLITFMPKTPEVIQLMHDKVFGFYVYSNSVEIQILVSVMIFLWASSTYYEMKRAGTAEEINKLTMEVATQRQAIQEEKQQLEEGIEQIISVQMQVANGNLSARVPLDQHNVLWALAGSLNNLIARLQRWRQDALRLQQNEQALQQLLSNIQMARRQGKPLQPYKTGTSLDPLIQEISKGVALPQQQDQSVSFQRPSDSWF
jgi:hypothetical protein